ncbi:hypothetical protein [Herpetosiphon giganteus]|uniref:hypothetical protein n=1 Tax=Herpetosiphon giganteus TaxID=2029754 RepID=UPI00195BB0AF|nr:hypothetical protein [Herpetosiphon giganteus]MBM7844640.1 hypothetical protein [Herpetosiphon giganteus]
MDGEWFPQEYYAALDSDAAIIQPTLRELLAPATPASKGLHELIVARDLAASLIQGCAELGIATYALSWWCHVTPTNRALYGCPHGFGGPPTNEGRFSECGQYPDYEIIAPLAGWPASPQAIAQLCAAQLQRSLTQKLPLEPFFRPCLAIGLCLAIPETW